FDLRNEDRPEHPTGRPGAEHEAVDFAGVLWPEVISHKRGHRPEPAPVAESHQDQQRGQQAEIARARNHKKERCLEQEHDRENMAPRDCIGQPRPKEPPIPLAMEMKMTMLVASWLLTPVV